MKSPASATAATVFQPVASLLQHERHLLHTLMDNLPDGIYFKDREGRFLLHNRAHARRLGLSDTMQAVGKTDFDFFTREHAQQAFDDEQEVIRTGEPITKEEKETWPNAPATWVITTKMPLRDETGRIIGTFGISRDITLRKESEEEIVALNSDLKNQVTQREEIYKELESFSYSVSHDLRAPIRHVEGFAQLLTRELEGQGTLSDKARSHLKTITDVSHGMGQLIDDLLAFSRVGRSEMRRHRVDLNLLLHDAVERLKPMTNGRNIVWTLPTLPVVMGDPLLLKLALTNLVGNAVKFTRPQNPAEIEIAVAGEKDGRVVVAVKDNGVGFDMNYKHKLFGVFHRLHRHDEFEGTGIGLAIVRRVIDRHGGQVWAESELGKGAAFYITLEKAGEA